MLLAVLFFVQAFPAWAAGQYEEQWRQQRASLPEGITFKISASAERYYIGEAIVLTLSFQANRPGQYGVDTTTRAFIAQYDPADEFFADDESHTEDPFKDRPGGRAMGGPRSPPELRDKPVTVQRTLNDWVRFKRPGKYRLYVRSHRLLRASPEPRVHGRLQWQRPGVAVVSNIIELEILPPPPGWEARQISGAIQALDSAETRHDDREQAVDTLRFIDSPEAVRALVAHIPERHRSVGFRMGFLASRHNGIALRAMENLLEDPGQPIGTPFLGLMGTLLIRHGPKVILEDSVQLARKEQEAMLGERFSAYLARLAASLPEKQPRARAVSAFALIRTAVQLRTSPPWLEAARGALLGTLGDLPNGLMQDLLSDRDADLFSNPKAAAVLLDLYMQRSVPEPRFPFSELALRVLVKATPEKARRLVVDEIRTRSRRIDWPTLAMLPDAELPELNDTFVQGFASGSIREELIVRYGTAAIAPDLKRLYLDRKNGETPVSPEPSCLSPIHLYFLKYDPGFGETTVRNVLAGEPRQGDCTDLSRLSFHLGTYVISPALERVAIDSLRSPSTPVKRGAAEVLGKFGSPAALKPLWEAMEQFRSSWKGREPELVAPGYRGDLPLQFALVYALAQGDWVLTEQDFARLHLLCSTDGCRQNVAAWRDRAGTPVLVSVYAMRSYLQVNIGYYGSNSREEFRGRLARFPMGTRFRVYRPPGTEALPEQIAGETWAREVILAAGHLVED